MFEQGCHNNRVKWSETKGKFTSLYVPNQELHLDSRSVDSCLNPVRPVGIPVQQNDQFHSRRQIVQEFSVPTACIENSLPQIISNP